MLKISEDEDIEKMLRLTAESIHFKGETLMLPAYTDPNPWKMNNVNRQIRFQTHYACVNLLVLRNVESSWPNGLAFEMNCFYSTAMFICLVHVHKLSELLWPMLFVTCWIGITNWTKTVDLIQDCVCHFVHIRLDLLSFNMLDQHQEMVVLFSW